MNKVRNHMREFLFGNIPTKFMALVLALLLWGYFFYTSVEKREITIPFKMNVPENANIRSVRLARDGSIVTDKITVVLKATKENFSRFDLRNMECVYDLSTDLLVGAENRTVVITRSHLNLPEGISLQPIQVSIDIVLFIEKRVPIVLSEKNIRGMPMDGHVLKELSPVSQDVLIKIPSDHQDEVTSLSIEPIDIEGKKGQFVSEAMIRTKHPYPVIPLEKVQVNVIIEYRPEERDVKIPIYAMKPIEFPFVIDVIPAEAVVRVQGAKKHIDELLSQPGAIELFFRMNHPINALQVGQKFNLPLLYRFENDAYRDTIRVIIMPGEKNTEVQVEIKSKKGE